MNFSTQIYIMLSVDTLGVLLIFMALLTHKLDNFSVKYRVAIALIGIGFLGQLAILSQILVTGTTQVQYTTNVYWFVKDTGIILWFSSAFYDIQFKHLCLRIYKRKERSETKHV